MSAQALIESLAAELSSVCGAAFVATPVDRGGEVAWRLEATDTTPPASAFVVGLSAEDAAAVAGRLPGPEAELGTRLAGWWTGALERMRPGSSGPWTGSVTTNEAPEPAWSTACRFESAEGLAVTASFAGDLSQPEDEAVGRAEAPASAMPAAATSNLDVILDIDLPLAVRFGGTDMTIDALTRLGPGALIDLGRSPDEPVDVLVNGRMVARGEVVVVGGNYGVRVTEVVSAADRLRSMGM